MSGSAHILHYWFVRVFTHAEDLDKNTVKAWGSKSWAGQGFMDAWMSQRTFKKKTKNGGLMSL